MAEIKLNMDSLRPKKEWKRHKVQDGSNIFRLLPPFGPEANGYPYRKWNVIWGLTDPSTGRKRPFASPITYEGKCPIYEYLELLKVKVEAMKAEFASQGMTEEMIKERLKATNYFISQLRPKVIYAYNACDKSGVVGILELKSTAHKKILELMGKYITDYNQDPTSLNSAMDDSGVWFNITRKGQGLQTEYGAEKNQSMIKDPNTGAISYQDDRSALPENVIKDYENLGYDLTGIYQKKSYDEMKQILIANLSMMVEENADLKIDGFYVGAGTTVTTNTTVETNASVSPQVTKGAGNIGIKLDNPNAVEPEATAQVTQPTPQAAQPVTPQPATTNSSDTEDLLKMADDIFNQ